MAGILTMVACGVVLSMLGLLVTRFLPQLSTLFLLLFGICIINEYTTKLPLEIIPVMVLKLILLVIWTVEPYIHSIRQILGAVWYKVIGVVQPITQRLYGLWHKVIDHHKLSVEESARPTEDDVSKEQRNREDFLLEIFQLVIQIYQKRIKQLNDQNQELQIFVKKLEKEVFELKAMQKKEAVPVNLPTETPDDLDDGN